MDKHAFAILNGRNAAASKYKHIDADAIRQDMGHARVLRFVERMATRDGLVLTVETRRRIAESLLEGAGD